MCFRIASLYLATAKSYGNTLIERIYIHPDVGVLVTQSMASRHVLNTHCACVIVATIDKPNVLTDVADRSVGQQNREDISVCDTEWLS